MIKNIDTRYTKALRKESWIKGALRDAGDVAHNVVCVGLGNALVVAPARLVHDTFHLDGDHMKWIRPLHRQRMDARKKIPDLAMERHYADQVAQEKREAAYADRQIEESRKPLKQKRVEAEARVFDRIASAWSSGETQPSAVLNQCAMAGLQELLDAGTITQDEFNAVQVNGQPGIFPAVVGRRQQGEMHLPGYYETDNRDKLDVCKAAVARQCIASHLVTEKMLDDANYPKDERGAYLFPDAGQEQFESSSTRSSSGVEI